jgi:lipopolysaccharide biosynthesis regulator YciM
MRFAKNSSSQNSLLRHAWQLGTLLLSLSLLAGCATTYVPEGDPERAKAAIELLNKDADAELANGNREKAVTLLTQAAKQDPANVDPWLKIADIRFAAGDYPASVLAANEVLQRDAVNQKAKSILVVAGLRIAAGAVNGLKQTGAIATSERVQAQNLTNALRDILGEKVLVPAIAPAAEEKPAARPQRRVARSHHAVISSAPAKTTTANAASADPFKSLK